MPRTLKVIVTMKEAKEPKNIRAVERKACKELQSQYKGDWKKAKVKCDAEEGAFVYEVQDD